MDSKLCNKYRQKKICRYCNSCPKKDQPPEIRLPKFDHCKTLYTKCDYCLERKVHGIILKLEKLFENYRKLFEEELKMQKELLNKMWSHSQRYLILDRGGVCVKTYPENVSVDAEQRELCKFHIDLKKIRISNCLLNQSMEVIKATFTELNKLCKQLDLTIESPFLMGTYFFNSLDQIKKILNDLLSYFDNHLCKMICCARFLDPGDEISIENYIEYIRDI